MRPWATRFLVSLAPHSWRRKPTSRPIRALFTMLTSPAIVSASCQAERPVMALPLLASPRLVSNGASR